MNGPFLRESACIKEKVLRLGVAWRIVEWEGTLPGSHWRKEAA